ncbi:MAG: hypothetical protein WB615_07675 [Candidatus Tumulicola sp.]
MAISWALFNRLGILNGSVGSTAWTAGHTNDAIEIDTSNLLVASDTGGVWLLSAGGIGLPLSMNWPDSDIASLAYLPESHQRYFAAGSSAQTSGAALYQTDISQEAPLWAPWLQVALPAGIGAVHKVVLEPSQYAILLATTTGLWWSRLPFTVPGSYDWQQASGPIAGLNVRSVDVSADGTVIAAAPNALFYGSWSVSTGILTMQAATMPNPLPNEFAFLCLACAPSSQLRAYAGASHFDPNDSAAGPSPVTAILRTDDGGRTWQRRPATNVATGGFIVDHSQNGYTGAIVVHPGNADVVCFGWTLGPWLSVDGAATFQLFGGNHDDKHGYRFGQSGTLYEASDGGVAHASFSNLSSWDGEFNRGLANLQFYSSSGRYITWGNFGVSSTVPGLVGGGLQDNANVSSRRFSNGSSSPWRVVSPLTLTDGQAMVFPGGSNTALTTFGASYGSTWDDARATFNVDSSALAIGTAHAGVATAGATLIAGPYAPIAQPQYSNASGERLLALAAYFDMTLQGNGAGDIYGLFASESFESPHWDYLANAPLPSGSVVSALASVDGRRIYVGARGTSHVWRIDTSDATVTPPTGFPDGSDFARYVAGIGILSDGTQTGVYAAVTQGDSSASIFTSPDGQGWTELDVAGGPSDAIVALVATGTPSAAKLFCASVSSVWMLDVQARTWTQVNDGLPRNAHCSGLELDVRNSGETYLHLATYGWSTWIAQIAGGQNIMMRDDVIHWLGVLGHRDRATWALENLPESFDPADFSRELDFLGVPSTALAKKASSAGKPSALPP